MYRLYDTIRNLIFKYSAETNFPSIKFMKRTRNIDITPVRASTSIFQLRNYLTNFTDIL